MTTKIKKALDLGLLEDAKKLLEKQFYNAEKMEWEAEQQKVYKASYLAKKTELTFENWLNETKTVLVGTEIAFDDEGIEYEKEIFEEQLIRQYIPNDFTNKIEEYLKPYIEKNILKEIENIELEALRPTRELLIDPNNEYAKNKLAKIEADIQVLRDKLNALNESQDILE